MLCLPCTTIAKITTGLQNKYHPDSSENKLSGSPTTRDIKKLHPSRWVGEVEAQRGVETEWHGEALEWVVPHSHVVGKHWEGYLRSQQSQPQTRIPSLGFQHQEDKFPSLLSIKSSGGWYCGRN